MRKHVLKLFFILCIFIKFNSSLYAEDHSTLIPKCKFKDILLVIHYNHPYYNSIEFLRNLYSPFFPNIIFYGEAAHPFVIQVETTIGSFFTRVMADALTRFPNYRGYVFLQDDVLMNVGNFSRLNTEKIWFGISRCFPGENNPDSWAIDFDRTQSRKDFFHATIDGAYNDGWFWWEHPYGVTVNAALSQLALQDWEMLERNIGQNELVAMVCDMYYIPQRFRSDAIRLSHVFSHVFCEIAVPMILNCLDNLENWEILKGIWEFNPSPTGFRTDPYFRSDVDWIHPLKFSSLSNQNYAQDVINCFSKTLPQTP